MLRFAAVKDEFRSSDFVYVSIVTAANLGLKFISVERRRHRARDTQLLAIVNGPPRPPRLASWSMTGLRSSSNRPGLIGLVISGLLVSTGMVAESFEVTPRAALKTVVELGLREMTGKGRFRAWGVV